MPKTAEHPTPTEGANAIPGPVSDFSTTSVRDACRQRMVNRTVTLCRHARPYQKGETGVGGVGNDIEQCEGDGEGRGGGGGWK